MDLERHGDVRTVVMNAGRGVFLCRRVEFTDAHDGPAIDIRQTTSTTSVTSGCGIGQPRDGRWPVGITSAVIWSRTPRMVIDCPGMYATRALRPASSVRQSARRTLISGSRSADHRGATRIRVSMTAPVPGMAMWCPTVCCVCRLRSGALPVADDQPPPDGPGWGPRARVRP